MTAAWPAGAVGSIGEGLFELGLAADSDGPVARVGFGGDAANTAVMAARMGAQSRLCGRVGCDTVGDMLLGFWRSNGVDTGAVRRDPGGPTGIYVNSADPATGGHSFDYHRKASAGSRLGVADVTTDFLRSLAVLHTTGVTLSISKSAAQAVREASARAHQAGAVVSFGVNHRAGLNPDDDQLRQAACGADIVFASIEDVRAILGLERPLEVQRALGCDELVLTGGPAGAGVVWEGAEHAAAAPAVEVVDAAGAGDALAGAYLAARVRGEPPPAALALGVTAASLACRAHGCALAYPSQDEVKADLAARVG